MQIPNSFSSGTVAKSEEVNENFTEVAAAILPTFVFPVVGALIVDTNVTSVLIVHKILTIEKVFGYVKTAPTGADIIIDINLNGTSIWNSTQANRLTISAGTQSQSQTSFDSTSIGEGDILTIDVDQVGSTVAGSDLTVEIRCN